MKIKLFTLALGILITGFFSACKQGSNLTDTMLTKASPPPTPANPAIVYSDLDNGSIAVMDSDGTHQTAVFNSLGNQVTWSEGSSVSWLVNGATTSIMAGDISVNANGVPVGSNVRTLSSVTRAVDSAYFLGAAWSATASVNLIAFGRNHAGNNAPNYLCTIPPSGGSATNVHAFDINSIVRAVTWSPDDSKLAVALRTTTGAWSIVIVDALNGSVTDSIPLSVTVVNDVIEWSRASNTINQLAFEGQDPAGTQYIYYLTPTSGSTPTHQSSPVGNANGTGFGCSPTWSPNNSGLMYIWATLKNGSYTRALNKVNTFGTLISTIQKPFDRAAFMNWHR